MTYKKINIKKFFSKFTQNQLIASLFGLYNIKNIPNILDVPDGGKISTDNAEEWQAFYLGLSDEDRVSIYGAIEKINYLSNFEASQIMESLKPIKSDGEKIISANDVIAENYSDKALAFYLDQENINKENEDKFGDAIHIYSFYKISGYKRYQAEGDIKNKNNLELTDNSISERFESMLEVQLGIYVKVNSKTLGYDNMHFTKITYMDQKEKEFNFVYIKEAGEVLVKAAGSKQLVFEYAENYIKKLTGYAMDPKEANYDMNIFIDKNYKDIYALNPSLREGAQSAEGVIQNQKYPLDNDNVIYDWYIKSIKLSRKINTISFNFTKSDEVKNMLPLYATLLESGIDITSYNIESLSVVATVKTNSSKSSKNKNSLDNVNSKSVKKNISLNIKDNSTNLNILKREHRELDRLLKDKKIFTGYKVIELKNKN